MSLIKCPECGKDVSDKAQVCIHCGYPLTEISLESLETICKCCGTSNSTSADYCEQCGIRLTPYIRSSPSSTYPTSPLKKRNSVLSILALIFSILGCTFFIAIVLAVIDLCKKDGRKKSLSIVALIISGTWLLIGIGNMLNNDTNNIETASSVEEISPSAPAQEPARESSETSEESPENSVKETFVPEEPVISEDDFKSSCQQFSYKTIARNPDDYIGQNFVVDVKVSQKINGKWYSDYDTYYKAYTNDKYDMWLGDFLYIIDWQDKAADSYLNILEDDIIRVYGTFNGMSESKNVLTGTTSNDISLDMRYCELIRE